MKRTGRSKCVYEWMYPLGLRCDHSMVFDKSASDRYQKLKADHANVKRFDS